MKFYGKALVIVAVFALGWSISGWYGNLKDIQDFSQTPVINTAEGLASGYEKMKDWNGHTALFPPHDALSPATQPTTQPSSWEE